MEEFKIRQAARKIRMIVLDLDGTTMNDLHVVTPHTRSVLQALLNKGYLVVPASGRGYYNVRDEILPGLDFSYMIADNGAYVVKRRGDEVLLEELISCGTAARMVTDLLDDDGNCLYVHYSNGCDIHRKACRSEEIYRRYYARPWDAPQPVYTAEQLRDLILTGGKGIPKIGLWFLRPDGFERYEERIALHYPEVSAYRVSENSLEFCSAATSKAAALRYLCGRLDMPAYQVCAMGDNGNDVEMLRFAGLGAAVENAISSAREAADVIAGPNDQEGAACFLEKIFLTEYQ